MAPSYGVERGGEEGRLPSGRYVVMDGAGNPVGTEDFRCAPGPAGWRYVADIQTRVPEPHREHIDLVVDAAWRPVRCRIETGEHRILLERRDGWSGQRDGGPVALPRVDLPDLDYLSPCFNAATANRLGATAEVEVLFLSPVTLEPRVEPQRYEPLGEEEVETPVGAFRAVRWRYTALRTGFTRDLWVAGELVVRYADLFELVAYDPGATGPVPLGEGPTA